MNLISLSIVSLSASVLITIMYQLNEAYIPSTLCLPFIDPTGKVFLIHIFNLVCWCISVNYICFNSNNAHIGSLQSKTLSKICWKIQAKPRHSYYDTTYYD